MADFLSRPLKVCMLACLTARRAYSSMCHTPEVSKSCNRQGCCNQSGGLLLSDFFASTIVQESFGCLNLKTCKHSLFSAVFKQGNDPQCCRVLEVETRASICPSDLKFFFCCRVYSARCFEGF